MRRQLLILALGLSLLILVTWAGTIITSVIPRRPTAHIQTTQAGPYRVILQVDPNPPPTTQSATIAMQIVRSDTGQPVTNAHVSLESNMESMDMGTEQVEAQHGHDGIYQAQLHFVMSGPWQVRVLVRVPNSRTENALFEVTAQ